MLTTNTLWADSVRIPTVAALSLVFWMELLGHSVMPIMGIAQLAGWLGSSDTVFVLALLIYMAISAGNEGRFTVPFADRVLVDGTQWVVRAATPRNSFALCRRWLVSL